MPASNKKTTRYHYIVFSLWLVFTLIAAIYFISDRLVSFDPEMKLTGKDKHFVINQLKQTGALKNLNLSNTIIHFTSNDCSCTQYSEEHKQSINKQANTQGMDVINFHVSPELSNVIPSTPAILIVNDAEELIYFGPYSTGLSCSTSNGYVEIVLNNYAKGYSSNLIVSDMTGCYCNV